MCATACSRGCEKSGVSTEPDDTHPETTRPDTTQPDAPGPTHEPDATTFADLGLRPELLERADRARLRGADADPARGDPAAAGGPRPARPGRHRHRQDRRVRAADAAAAGRTAAGGTSPSALVLVPTRELAVQVSEAIHRYGRDLGARVLPIYGGQPIGRQLQALRARRRRRRRHARAGRSTTSAAARCDLDGLRDRSCSTRPTRCSTWASPRTSRRSSQATPDEPPDRAVLGHDAAADRRHRPPPPARPGAHPDRAASRPAPGEAPQVRQSAYVVARAHKPAALGRVLDVEAPTAAIVFCRTRDEVDQLTETLNGRGYRAEALHGGMSQEQRDRVMGRLRAGTADLLVATDVAARGLDIEQLTHVVNYDVPVGARGLRAPHRPGRPGRPRGRRDHPGRAARAPDAQDHRAGHQAADHRSRRCPTVADLRARRLELTRAALHESLLEDDLDRFRVVVETLADEFDLDGGRARRGEARARGGRCGDADEEEIPEVAAPREPRRERPRTAGRDAGRREPRAARPSAPGGRA